MGEVLPFRRPDVAAAAPPDNRRATEPDPVGPAGPRPLDPLWREVAGNVLREQRHRREQTLTEVAHRAGISVQYLSEVERGRKEPSSEILGAVSGALDLTLVDLTRLVLHRLSPVNVASRPSGPLAMAA